LSQEQYLQLKIFGKWDTKVEVTDPSLKKYISLTPIYLPHSGGRYANKRFGKSKMSLVERLANMMMRKGRNKGKKLMSLSIVKTALELVELRANQNPLQVLVKAIENAAPREETTRIMYGGIVYYVAVDISPQRRIDLALRHISMGAYEASFNKVKPIEESLADEIIYAYQGDTKSFAIRKKDEIERIALSSR
jgi:small subunit ribosomal protein S7